MRSIAVLCLLVPALATADDDDLDRGYVAASWAMTMRAPDASTRIVGFEAAYRPWARWLWLRALAGIGSGGDAAEHTDLEVVHARVGAELHLCSSGGGACGYLGVDSGIHRTAQTGGLEEDMSGTTVGGVLVARGGFDGGGLVRFRIGLAAAAGDGVGLELALIHRFY